ncbi:hypothetical protein CEP50_19165 [Actinopolyspora mortivallis]|uniref:Uncharacterized protein n=2 Tax=Actinopolyspora mortivallis TaxID=33906 RepID=A0A2T0GRK0_ACTMO|nr:hypothetical protein CEP50_19165 [Actinopolyspora mortivallis]
MARLPESRGHASALGTTARLVLFLVTLAACWLLAQWAGEQRANAAGAPEEPERSHSVVDVSPVEVTVEPVHVEVSVSPDEQRSSPTGKPAGEPQRAESSAENSVVESALVDPPEIRPLGTTAVLDSAEPSPETGAVTPPPRTRPAPRHGGDEHRADSRPEPAPNTVDTAGGSAESAGTDTTGSAPTDTERSSGTGADTAPAPSPLPTAPHAGGTVTDTDSTTPPATPRGPDPFGERNRPLPAAPPAPGPCGAQSAQSNAGFGVRDHDAVNTDPLSLPPPSEIRSEPDGDLLGTGIKTVVPVTSPD